MLGTRLKFAIVKMDWKEKSIAKGMTRIVQTWGEECSILGLSMVTIKKDMMHTLFKAKKCMQG